MSWQLLETQESRLDFTLASISGSLGSKKPDLPGIVQMFCPFGKNILRSGKGENCAELNSFVFFLFVQFARSGALRFRATEARK
jgi:hypothetical protein